MHVFLRPPLPSDYDLILLAEVSEALGTRWRHRGATPSPEDFLKHLWVGVLAQFLVVSTKTQRPIGIVFAYNPDFQDGHAYIAAAKFDPSDRSPKLLFGLALFVNYLFTNWTFRKLYAESTELNVAQFASGADRIWVEEGRLRDHLFSRGRYWDMRILAVYRSEWESRSKPWLEVILKDGSAGGHT